MADAWLWLAFHAAVLFMLALDLSIIGRRRDGPTFRHAAVWSCVWIALGLAFGAVVHARFGADSATAYFAAYLLEKALSVDNLFVFTLIFAGLGIAPAHRPRILLWGVVGALAMRGAMIAAGAALVASFAWVLYVFGAFLVVTGWRMWASGPRSHERAGHPSMAAPAGPSAIVEPGQPSVALDLAAERIPGRTLRLLNRVLPIDHTDRSGRFLLRREGRLLPLAGTPLLLALVLVETTDLAFALDSIPAVFAITRDPFIVYTSNIMAVLGLRALYFLVAGGLDRLRYLRHGLAAILVFIGAKMLLAHWWHVPIGASLAVIGALLAIAAAMSAIASRSPGPIRTPRPGRG